MRVRRDPLRGPCRSRCDVELPLSRLSASEWQAYAAVLVVPKTAVEIRGEPRYYRTVGKSGKAVERGFCAACGSQVMLKLERMPDVIGLQAGTLDDPSIYKPTMDIFAQSAYAWDHMSPTTQKLAGLPTSNA
jgi:hypothetical protein